ncbi:unnamed protein product, partial [Didymodactylos carnosus]
MMDDIQREDEELSLLEAIKTINKTVRVWEDVVEIETYGVDIPEKNPIFTDKGKKNYPHPVNDKVLNEPKIKPYHMVNLENEYLHIFFLPELGGRIHRAIDRTNNHEFIYHNTFVKPVLLDSLSSTIPGGIGFIWPQHQKSYTYSPVEYGILQNSDGSKTVWTSEIDRITGLKMMANFTLYPGKAYLEISVQIYNRTFLPQTFSWWANVAVPMNDNTQSIFPSDVYAVYDQDQDIVSKYPIADSLDISLHKNLIGTTTYMTDHSEYDFFGIYDNKKNAGTLLIANHHIAPGKKQRMWRDEDFDQVSNRNLTGEDSSYVELMSGVYTDHKANLSWINPYEEKSFKVYVLPYKSIGAAIKNSTVHAAINLDIDSESHRATLHVYATSVYNIAIIDLRSKTKVYINDTVTISPTQPFSRTIILNTDEQPHNLTVKVKDADNNILVAYRPEQERLQKLPSLPPDMVLPSEMKNNEKLYCAGLHLEQIKYTMLESELYYLEGLKRDPDDIRLNVAYGLLLLRKGLFRLSENHFLQAITTLTQHNSNPYDSEAYYQLGLSLKLQGRIDKAYSIFYKATWSSTWQDSAYFHLAQIACSQHAYSDALELVDKALSRNNRNCQARNLRIAILRKLGRFDDAINYALETIQLNVSDFGSSYELYLLDRLGDDLDRAVKVKEDLISLMRNDVHNFISLANEYSHSGLYQESVDLLDLYLARNGNSKIYPMIYYYLGHFHEKLKQMERAQAHRKSAAVALSDYCFPNTLDDMFVLESALAANPDDSYAHYYLGNLLYDKRRYSDAVEHWEVSRNLLDTFAIVHRNLAIAYYNHLEQPEQALESLEQAMTCDMNDARVLYELDQLYKKFNYVPEKRLEKLEVQLNLVKTRDDLYLEYITLLNITQQSSKAYDLILTHPWQANGREKEKRQCVFSCIELAKQSIIMQQFSEAINVLQSASKFSSELTLRNDILYYMGLAYRGIHQNDEADELFQKATENGQQTSTDAIYYQGLAYLNLGNDKKAKNCFNQLIDYGEQHMFNDRILNLSVSDCRIFHDDKNKRKKINSYYLLGLGYLGLDIKSKAYTHLTNVLKLENSHQEALLHIADVEFQGRRLSFAS